MDIQEVSEIWEKVKQELSTKVQDSSLTWIEALEPLGFENDCFTLLTGHSLAVSLLNKNHYKDFSDAFKKILGQEIDFEITYDATLSKKLKKEKERQAKKAQKEKRDEQLSNLAQMQSFSNLNLRYKFENFVVGSNNEFAQAVAMAVAKTPSKKGFNPLFIYGASGLGKTHLMQAIGHYILYNHQKLKVKYVTTENFMNELIENVRFGGDKSERMSKFRQKYRNVDVLLLDDVQFLESKKSTMEEIFNTFESLYGKNKQIVIASDRPPKEIPTLDDRLISRFEWGIVVELTPPDFETRLAILKNLAENVEVKFTYKVLELIANNFKKNVRELEGAFNKVNAYTLLKNEPPSIDLTKKILKLDEIKKEITPEKIIDSVCKEFEVTEKELKSSVRSQNITIPRQIAILLIRELLNKSYEEIGKIFNRKHTSILYGHEQIKEKQQINIDLRKKIEKIKKDID